MVGVGAFVEGAALEESVDEIKEPESEVKAEEMIEEELVPAYVPVETDVANVDGVDVTNVIDVPESPLK